VSVKSHLLSLSGCALLVVVAVLAACSGPTNEDLPSYPHPIILIDVGTLRADFLGCYGYDRDTSPYIDVLAGESALFEWSFSQAPHTAPSQASILTGLYPGTHGVVPEGGRLPGEAITLARALADHGYETAAFVDGGYLSAEFGLQQGFLSHHNSHGAGLAEIVPKALGWLRENASREFLLLIHTYDTHAPYSPPQRYRELFIKHESEAASAVTASRLDAVHLAAQGQRPPALSPAELEYAEALYAAEIRFVDDKIGELLEGIRELGLDERATIVLVSDHGEEFQEHGSLFHDKLYSTVMHVPMMIRMPGGRKAGRISKIVETIDLMPTLLDLAGAPHPPGIQGQSLLPLVLGEGKPPYVAFGESGFFGGQSYVALGGYRMIVSAESGKAELYSFLDDPLELDDLASSDPERVQVLQRRLDAWKELVTKAALGQETAPLEEDTLEQLRSLGYVQ
jgi:arylsulfatase A-like enzyme